MAVSLRDGTMRDGPRVSKSSILHGLRQNKYGDEQVTGKER